MSDDVVVTTMDTLNPPAADTPAPTATPETPRETKSEVQTTENAAPQDTPEQPEKTEEPPPIPKGVQKRIDRAVREKYQAEARSKMLEERLAAIEARQQQQPAQQAPKAEGEPKLADFSDFEEYVAAKAAFVAQKHIDTTLTTLEKKASEQQAKSVQQRVLDDWSKKVALATKEIPDYNEIVGEAELPLTPAMRETIMDSEVGPKVAYYLATHPEETQKIAGLTPLGTVRALMRIEDGLKAKPITATPAPITPTGSRQTAGVKSLTDAMTQEEFEKRRRAFIARR